VRQRKSALCRGHEIVEHRQRHIVHVAFPTLDYFHVGLEGMRELTGDEPGALLKAADQDLSAAFVAAM
jgi:hypothetical protein